MTKTVKAHTDNALTELKRIPVLPLAAVMAAILGISALTAYVYLDAVVADSKETLMDQLDRSAKLSSSYLRNRLRIVRILAQEASTELSDTPTERELLDLSRKLQLINTAGIFADVGFIDSRYDYYTCKGEKNPLEELPGIERAFKGETGISLPFHDADSNERRIIFFSPVVVDGSVRAVIAGSQPTNILEEQFTQDFMKGMGRCYFIDFQGNIILYSRSSPYRDKKALFDILAAYTEVPETGYEELRRQALDFRDSNDRITSVANKKGGSLILGYKSFPDYPDWKILCIIDQDSILRSSFTLLGKIFIFSAFLLTGVLILLAIIFLQRSKSRSRLYQVAFIDEVTDGWNYTYFKKNASSLIDADDRYFIFRLDIAHFKYINRSLGNDTGNLVLKAVYDCIRSHEGSNPCLLASRVINDEFIALCRDDDPANPDPAKQLIAELNRLPKARGFSCNLQYYIGASRVPPGETDLERTTDFAYVAQKNYEKAAVKKQYLFDTAMFRASHMEDIIESHMEEALLAGEFRVFLQPKVDIATGRTVNAEALIRWDSPRFGFMSPDEFVPLFERNGFIQRLDFYVLDTVCSWMKERIKQRLPYVPISVNQSRLHCYNNEYITQVLDITTRHSVPFRDIEFEITESVVLENIETLARYFAALRSLGFKISIDDFGSGNTALSFLKSLDVDIVKIDKSLIDDAESSHKRRTMMKHIIAMSHELGMEVVCEGVETRSQLDIVRSMGCDIVQGYYYSKALSKDDFFTIINDEFAESQASIC